MIGDCERMARMRRDDRIAEFREAVANLIEFAIADGEMRNGRRSRQTNDAAKWLRAAFRDAINAGQEE